jgi:hypothetical protein
MKNAAISIAPTPNRARPGKPPASRSHQPHSDDPELPGARSERDAAKDGGHQADDGAPDSVLGKGTPEWRPRRQVAVRHRTPGQSDADDDRRPEQHEDEPRQDADPARCIRHRARATDDAEGEQDDEDPVLRQNRVEFAGRRSVLVGQAQHARRQGGQLSEAGQSSSSGHRSCHVKRWISA